LEIGLDDYVDVYIRKSLSTGVVIKEKKTNLEGYIRRFLSTGVVIKEKTTSLEGFKNVGLNITVAMKI